MDGLMKKWIFSATYLCLFATEASVIGIKSHNKEPSDCESQIERALQNQDCSEWPEPCGWADMIAAERWWPRHSFADSLVNRFAIDRDDFGLEFDTSGIGWATIQNVIDDDALVIQFTDRHTQAAADSLREFAIIDWSAQMSIGDRPNEIS